MLPPSDESKPQANMSHELRTPLNAVIAFSSFAVEDESLNQVTKEYLKTSLTSATALLGIISKVLEFSKLSADKVVQGATAKALVLSPMNLSQARRDVLRCAAPPRSAAPVLLFLAITPIGD